MKKVRIAGCICAFLALVLEILPFGIIMKWDGFYREASFHSYFDTEVFGYGNIGPFFCAVLTSVLFCMMLSTLFFKVHRAYTLSVCVIAFVTVVFSLTPTLYNQYSIFGVIITLLLSVSAELFTMAYINRNK